MSSGALVGAGLLVAAAVVWAVGSAGLVPTRALDGFPRSRSGGRGRYALTYGLTLVLVVFGVLMLGDAVGVWALLAVVAVFIPQWLIAVVRRRRARPRAAARGTR